VTGIDFTPTLLDHARERAAAERVPITFQDGDAESLPFSDCTFDVVLSTFGVMFAPNQSLAASELLRVCKSGGKIGLTNWTPNGFVGQSGLISAQFVSLATQDLPPTRWGTEKGIQALLGDTVTSLQITKRTTTFRYKSIEHYLDCYRTYFGPMIRAFETLSRLEQKHLQDALIDNVVHFNQSGDETVAVPAEYLEVIAVKR
jgi:ubiquinone/menaquinone biosynthesis C-methylase UbiE